MKYKKNSSCLLLEFMADYPDPPETDNEKILIYQDEYRAGKRDAAKKLFFQMRACAKRFVYHERQMKGFWISGEDAAEKATMAAEYVMEQFIKRPDFKLQTPSAYIRLRVLAALYRHKKIDEYLSFSDKEF